MANKVRKVSIFEIVWYSITGALGLWGLTFITLGVIARNLRSSAGLFKADAAWNKATNLGFFGWGVIIFVSAVLLAVIVLLVNAKKADREVEKEQRRAARLAAATTASEEAAAE